MVVIHDVGFRFNLILDIGMSLPVARNEGAGQLRSKPQNLVHPHVLQVLTNMPL